jgi:ABC-type uncharacterized transport system ATPase subunit
MRRLGMLQIDHLSKSFEEIKAVDDISFEVAEGEIFGFLGPNGAGKTTTISMIAGLIKPDSGKIHINSLDLDGDIKKIKRLMELVPRGMRTLGFILPTGWAMDALHKLIFFGYGFEAILPHIGALFLFTVVFLFLAIKFFKLRKN